MPSPTLSHLPLSLQQIATVYPLFWVGSVGLIAFIEGQTIKDAWGTVSPVTGVGNLKEEYYPGDLGFDPLGEKIVSERQSSLVRLPGRGPRRTQASLLASCRDFVVPLSRYASCSPISLLFFLVACFRVSRLVLLHWYFLKAWRPRTGRTSA